MGEVVVGSVRMTQVTALVLRAVALGHRYGFDVMERCGLPSGTVYPALRRLDRAGLLASGWEDADVARAEGRPRRRTYRLPGAARACWHGVGGGRAWRGRGGVRDAARTG